MKIVFDEAYIERQRKMLDKYRTHDARIDKFLAALDEIERLRMGELHQNNKHVYFLVGGKYDGQYLLSDFIVETIGPNIFDAPNMRPYRRGVTMAYKDESGNVYKIATIYKQDPEAND